MSTPSKKKKTISDAEFDRRFDKGEDVSDYLDVKNAIVVKRVNVDLPTWMIQLLDQEASRLNISRQAVIKILINNHLMSLKKTG